MKKKTEYNITSQNNWEGLDIIRKCFFCKEDMKVYVEKTDYQTFVNDNSGHGGHNINSDIHHAYCDCEGYKKLYQQHKNLSLIEFLNQFPNK